MEKRELVFMDAKSSKFWNIRLDGDSHTVNYGRMNTDGQTKTKEFADSDAATSHRDKLVQEKVRKGYQETAG